MITATPDIVESVRSPGRSGSRQSSYPRFYESYSDGTFERSTTVQEVVLVDNNTLYKLFFTRGHLNLAVPRTPRLSGEMRVFLRR